MSFAAIIEGEELVLVGHLHVHHEQLTVFLLLLHGWHLKQCYMGSPDNEVAGESSDIFSSLDLATSADYLAAVDDDIPEVASPWSTMAARVSRWPHGLVGDGGEGGASSTTSPLLPPRRCRPDAAGRGSCRWFCRSTHPDTLVGSGRGLIRRRCWPSRRRRQRWWAHPMALPRLPPWKGKDGGQFRLIIH
ncbi:Os05g0301950 [Oryza sativa Japonica Group]|uniref:Os05g0301950 protein n=1 Tax=Oryza sativa subsp. japonica TaxID=39947 RepID=A0A0P0WKF3_ORYSJ|nr:Os05g0301950 [Oryza sativa Japonica Group]